MSQFYLCPKKCCSIEVCTPNFHKYEKIKRTNKKAGAFIYDVEQKKILLVQSRGQLWGCPKGTVEEDKGENIVDCAIREVKEETGLELKIEDFLKMFKIKNRAFYYYVEKPEEKLFIPKNIKDNDATGLTWIKINCINDCIKNGFININQHCKLMIKKIFNIDTEQEEFTRIRYKK